MSISPTQSQSQPSATSPPRDSPSLNPISGHGNNQFSPPPPSSSSPLPLQFRSPIAVSGSTASAAQDSAGSSRRLNESEAVNGKRSLARQNGETHLQPQVSGEGVESTSSSGRTSGSIAIARSPPNAGSTNSQGSSTLSSGRRAHMMNANHLLNFQYDPVGRPQPRGPPPRRPHKMKPYNKDLFLQANYKFVVLDTGDYAPESMDPDKMLRWEDIICLRYSTPFPVQCPICLEDPLCPQITSCGHIFCFPCILQYLLMGVEDDKGNCFKRCPLCFMMQSPRDLYTIYIENVKQYHVGDAIEFMLLTRQKDSYTPSQKSKQEADAASSYNGDAYDPFSKFTFTSDVELSVRKAISDLDSWLVRADSGLVDDLEKLPYVCAAMEHLKRRKKYWNQQKASHNDASSKLIDSQKGSKGHLPTADEISLSRCSTPFVVNNEDKCVDNVPLDVVDSSKDEGTGSSSSSNGTKILHKPSIFSQSVKDTDSYNFYQAVDGQHIILHSLNMKCLLNHYGSYDSLPHRISGKILQLETMTQSEAMRRRYRYLSHFSLTTTYQLSEIDLSEVLPSDALLPFMDEIKKREKQRKQLANKERREKIKAEAAAAQTSPNLSNFGQSFYGYDQPPKFSMDDFEALGTSPPTSSSPPVTGDKALFSNVARLGFAAVHDSPALRIEETDGVQNRDANESSSVAGLRNPGTPSFANVMSRPKSGENLVVPKMNESGKKGKKPSRVLLSTATGRRY